MISAVLEHLLPRRRLLCLGAHADDIEIGCGGTILKLIQRIPKLEVSWVVFSAEGKRKQEALRSADQFLAGLKTRNIVVKRFKGSFFPYQGAAVKRYFEMLKRSSAPDLILTHYRDDLHQDHRVINECTWNTFRDHPILEYEIPKYDGDLGVPNLFVHIDEAIAQEKIRILLEQFKTQREKHWFTEDTFRALLRIRGVESNAPQKYAEAFYCRKLVL